MKYWDKKGPTKPKPNHIDAKYVYEYAPKFKGEMDEMQWQEFYEDYIEMLYAGEVNHCYIAPQGKGLCIVEMEDE